MVSIKSSLALARLSRNVGVLNTIAADSRNTIDRNLESAARMLGVNPATAKIAEEIVKGLKKANALLKDKSLVDSRSDVARLQQALRSELTESIGESQSSEENEKEFLEFFKELDYYLGNIDDNLTYVLSKIEAFTP